MRKYILFTTLQILSLKAIAAPPIDLNDPAALEKAPQRRRIRNPKLKDLTYTDDHTKFDIKIPPDAGYIQFDIIGRSLPNREGKPLANLTNGDPVAFIKDSRDKHWSLVQSIEYQPIKAWIPNNSVKFPLSHPASQPKEIVPPAPVIAPIPKPSTSTSPPNLPDQ